MFNNVLQWLKIHRPFIIIRNPNFYDGMDGPSVDCNDPEIVKFFKDFGSIYDQIYTISNTIIKDCNFSEEELKKAESAAQSINDMNCDFRIYHLKDAIKHAVWCEQYRRGFLKPNTKGD